LSLEDAMSHVKDIAEGLQYAGSKNLIHRDIKPDNIMFAEDGRAVITDFGIARDASSESNMTMAGSVIGTPQYMSPEQAGAKTLDHRTDLYSLGIILYQILAGRTPFKGDSAIATGVMHITKPVPPLPVKYAQFQGFIDIALAKNPDDRFQSGHEFIQALSKISLELQEDDDVATLLMSGDDMNAALKSSGGNTKEDPDLMLDLSDEFLSPTPTPIPETRSIKQESLQQSSKPKSIYEPSNTSFSGLTLDDVVEKPRTEIPIEEKEKREFSLRVPSTYLVLLVLLLGSVTAHIVYVNVLGKQIPFFTLAMNLASATESVIGLKPDFTPTASKLARASNSFGGFSEQIFGKILPAKSELFGLSHKEKQIAELLDFAIEDGRLYSPVFNCAELYLQELRLINPNSAIVKVREKELLTLSLDNALRLIDDKQFDKAEELIVGSKNLLPYVRDKQLRLRHRQVASTLVIAR